MKTVLASILLALLVVATSTPAKDEKESVNVDEILSKSQTNLSKATTVTKLADQQQKEKMVEILETVEKLQAEKCKLQLELKQAKNEQQAAEHIDNMPIDTGEQFQLFPEN